MDPTGCPRGSSAIPACQLYQALVCLCICAGCVLRHIFFLHAYYVNSVHPHLWSNATSSMRLSLAFPPPAPMLFAPSLFQTPTALDLSLFSFHPAVYYEVCLTLPLLSISSWVERHCLCHPHVPEKPLVCCLTYSRLPKNLCQLNQCVCVCVCL